MHQQPRLNAERNQQKDPRVAYWVAMTQQQAERWDGVIANADPELVRAAVRHFEQQEAMVERFPIIYLELRILHRRQVRQARKQRLRALARWIKGVFASASSPALARG